MRHFLQVQGSREPARKGGTEHREAGAKSIKELRGGVLKYAAQAIPRIDTEIVKKGHFWMETS